MSCVGLPPEDEPICTRDELAEAWGYDPDREDRARLARRVRRGHGGQREAQLAQLSFRVGARALPEPINVGDEIDDEDEFA